MTGSSADSSLFPASRSASSVGSASGSASRVSPLRTRDVPRFSKEIQGKVSTLLIFVVPLAFIGMFAGGALAGMSNEIGMPAFATNAEAVKNFYLSMGIIIAVGCFLYLCNFENVDKFILYKSVEQNPSAAS